MDSGLNPTFATCRLVTLGQSLTLSGPQLCHLEHVGKWGMKWGNITLLRGSCEAWMTMCVEHRSEQCLALSVCAVSINRMLEGKFSDTC